MLTFRKFLLIAVAALSGFLILRQIAGNENIAVAGGVSGLLIALAALRFEQRVNKTPLKVVAGGTLGLMAGFVLANLITYPLVLGFFDKPYLEYIAYISVNFVVGYLGLSIGMKKGDEFSWDQLSNILSLILKKHAENTGNEKTPLPRLILDTSVIIDGRIADICDTGFIDGVLIVPQFVLEELQAIADSSDPLKRTRGTRGLDILDRLQNQTSTIDVTVTNEDIRSTKKVDMKLVELARKNKTKILTNDINLTKVAKLNGVPVLNINSLVNALKPVLLPGEDMQILCAKEGKERNQGVGYLDDGTMVVIDNGTYSVGKTVMVTVTSILQTANGRMIFSKLKEDTNSRTQPVVRAVD